ncbi:MAG TPA: hypothetical protein VD994_09455, partial [Prosthecobacter sp.]|nr:hypothetical protein [Prosthecobacter sp.]
MDFPPAITKALKPLGHELVLWREAIILLHGRLAKHRLPPDLGAFVARWLPAAPAPVPDEFEIGVGELANGGLRLQSSSVPFASDPTWWALLQLPALKGHWAADLRTSHHDHLLAILPRAWMMDPAPLPPGAV